MEKENPLQIFADESPEVQKAYAGFIQSLIDIKGLDNKTKQLIYIGMKVVADDERAVKVHVPMAKNAGATREEVKATVLLGLSVGTLQGQAHSLHALDHRTQSIEEIGFVMFVAVNPATQSNREKKKAESFFKIFKKA
ncbi:MAG TPA: carboxymuconolactone decarboxylase family protein [bacterium]|nr:carboxymuconolactone decarboxylase family protein [bacterium]